MKACGRFWKGSFTEWATAVATTATVVIAALALCEAARATRKNIEILNADKTPWLVQPEVQLIGKQGPEKLDYSVALTLTNNGGGPALDAEVTMSNWLGHTGKAKRLAVMPGAKLIFVVPYEQKARDTQQLQQWIEQSYDRAEAWIAYRLTYSRVDGRRYEMTDTGNLIHLALSGSQAPGSTAVNWRGLALRELSSD